MHYHHYHGHYYFDYYHSRSINKLPAASGFVLIVTLLLLMALSLLAASSLRSNITAERIVANERDKLLAFEGAESALNAAITRILQGALTNMPKAYYSSPLPGGASIRFWRTASDISTISNCTVSLPYVDAERFDWVNCSRITANKYENLEYPQYVIENFPQPSTNNDVKRYFYRITARATGGSGKSEVILQQMYFKDLDCTNLPKDGKCKLYFDPGLYRLSWMQFE